jgi:uroporphyrinogen III methyltransferase/synthase
VALVGAGPGHPGLLTVRAVECLSRADLVLHDRLVPARLLEAAPPTAERVCVDALHGCRPDRYPEVHQLMIDAARQGRRVVRLKGGDPFVFGRGGEEAEALARAGIPFEVVPGVTAALGAAAFAGIPLTHRSHASTVALVTGHQKPDADHDWSALARFPGTLVIYMGMSRLPDIVAQLIRNGKAADTPAAVVRQATTPEQHTLVAPLGGLPDAVAAAGLKAPAVVIVGPVVGLRSSLVWFESRPLFGKHVLVTRPREQAGGMVRSLEELGAAVHVFAAVEIGEPADWSPVDRAVAELDSFAWLVFTSANGVAGLVRRLRQTGRDLRALGGLRLAAIGPATADALRALHLEPDLVPGVYTSEGLAAELEAQAAGQRVLLARADRGRDVLREQLGGVCDVVQVAVYSQRDAGALDASLLQRLREGAIDYVTLTSSNIARAFARALDGPALQKVREGVIGLVTISPVTSAAVLELGLPVAAAAREATAAGVVAALVQLAAAK